MPRGIHVCAWPGCPTLTAGQYCADHTRTSSRNHGGVPAAQRGYDPEYRRARAVQIAAVPWCQCRECPEHAGRMCGARWPLTADHIVPLSQGGDPHGPLRTMCRACANRQGARLAQVSA